MSYLEVYVKGHKPTEFEELTDEEWKALINKFNAAQRKAEEERIIKEKKEKDDYQAMLVERQKEALRKQKEWEEYRKTLHGCGCVVKNGDEKQSGICLDCYGQESD